MSTTRRGAGRTTGANVRSPRRSPLFGGLAGNLVTSAVVSSVTIAGSEMSWATVEADGKRLANDVAKNLGQFFAAQGWIAYAN